MRLLLALGCSFVLAGCGNGSPAAPSPSLTFTVTPNPVPYSGLLAVCEGATSAIKTWVYTLRIQNTGNAGFVVSSFSGRVTSPLLPNPVDIPFDAGRFAAAFGTTTIAPQATVSSPLCVAGHYDSATLVWTIVGASGGGTFTAPPIQFTPS
jgi:hypothetical protein